MYTMINFIQGVSFGFEFVEDPDEDIYWLVIDVFVIRFMFGR